MLNRTKLLSPDVDCPRHMVHFVIGRWTQELAIGNGSGVTERKLLTWRKKRIGTSTEPCGKLPFTATVLPLPERS